MLLIFHIIVALSSIGLSGLAAVKPSTGRIKRSYALVALTLISGTTLTVTSGTHLAQTCLSGLIYCFVVSSAIFVANRRLAA